MENNNIEEIGKQAATLSLIELGLGSLLHSFKLPLSGHLLSINQIALLSRSSFKLKSSSPALQISLVASFLKSLSPSGKKLTPMLAIAAQGVLYYLGLFIFGINYIGLFFAVMTSSLWAFLQPVLFIYLLFGKNSISVAEYFIKELSLIFPRADHFLFWLLLGTIIVKLVIAFFFSLLAIKISDRNFDLYQKRILLNIKMKPSNNHSHAYLAFRDLLNPMFLISFFMTILFFIFSNSTLNHVQIIWWLLRPIAIGFIIFYGIRVYPIENFSLLLHKKGFTQLGKILDIAISEICKNR